MTTIDATMFAALPYGMRDSLISPRKVANKVQLDPSAFLADPELIQALEKRATPVSCGEDRVLFRRGDPPMGIFILRTGEAAISMISDSDTIDLSCHATAGSLLGLPGVIADQPYSLTAIARKGANVSFVSKDEFNDLMQSEQSLMVKILQVLAAEVRSARLAITQG
jgi:CRP-like cAMP-binding protein